MIINDNIFNVLPTIEKYSQNLIFSDPPYNLSSKWKILDDKVVLDGKANDFMSKWEGLCDKDLEIMFEEFYRVLKHGGYCCMWSLNRQHLPFLYYANKAGFEQLQSINSFFISSFPKAMDLSKALDRYYGEERTEVFIREDFYKRSNKNNFETNSVGIQGEKGRYTKPVGDLGKKYDGYKSSIVPLKEVSETLLVFRKPFKYKQIVQDIIAKEEDNESDIHGCGINIDGNRVETTKENEPYINRFIEKNGKGYSYSDKKTYQGQSFQENSTLQVVDKADGRYPSNLYLIDGFNYTPEYIKEILINKQLHIFENIGIDMEPLEYMTEEKQIEYICKYLGKFEVSKVLDEQSGVTKSWSGQNHNNFNPYGGNALLKSNTERKGFFGGYDDEAGCSRILHKCLYELEEYNLFNYCTKVNSHERNSGCDNLEDKKFGTYAQDEWSQQNMGNSPDAFRLSVKNNHPTLKSLKLNYSLINLFLCPKEDIKDFKILIPFCGVQSEYMSAMALGIPEKNITGIEISKEYCEIGEARKAYWIKHNFYFKEDKGNLNNFKDTAENKEKTDKIKKLF